MRKTLLYIISAGAFALSSCSEDMMELEYVMDGTEKTPITVVTNLASAPVGTRAVDMKFEGGEVLLAYLQAGKKEGDTFMTVPDEATAASATLTTEQAARFCNLQTFNVSESPANEAYNNTPNIQFTTNLDCNSVASKYIFWDDYSTKEYDLRENTAEYRRGLRLYYGYCYNGGTPTTDLAEATGIIGWTVATDQHEGFKTSDLLFAKTQEPIYYNRATKPDLVIPYTHAMSKITIEIDCKDGFKDVESNFSDASVVFKAFNTVCNVNAPAATVTGANTIKNITALAIPNTNTNRSYSILVPPTEISSTKDLATLFKIDGNDYEVILTEAILTAGYNGAEAWSSKLEGYNSSTKAGTTKPGVNYHLKVFVDKQKITVMATIQNWDVVSAETTGVIQFANDITTTTGTIADELRTGGFDVYKKGITAGATYDSNTSTPDVTDPLTSLSWNTATSKWDYSPVVYWQDKDDKSYFRALSPKATSLSMTNTSSEILWGTTAKDETNSINEGDPIAPRTGNVPISFSRPMSMVTFVLQNDPDKSASDPICVDLDGAKIQLTYLYENGTIDLHDGEIINLTIRDAEVFNTPLTTTFTAATDEAREKATAYQYMIPQALTPYTDNGVTYTPCIKIILEDGTTYSAQLSTCKVETSSTSNHTVGGYIEQWYRNTQYTYTITLSKEQIKLAAFIKEWENTSGSGFADLEW